MNISWDCLGEEEEERVNVTVRLSTSQSATEHYLLARVRDYLHLLSFHANISKMFNRNINNDIDWMKQ